MQGKNCHYSHFPDEKTVAQKGKLIAHDYVTWSGSEPGFKPRDA